METIEGADVLIQIRSESNVREMVDDPPHKLMLSMSAMGAAVSVVNSKRWSVTLHPTAALAQEAGKSLEAFADFVYGAIILDWPAMTRQMQVLADCMGKTRKIRIVGKETDISFSIEGRKPIVDGGEKNLTGGEVYTSPADDSADGLVYFDKPIISQGQEISGVRLTLKDGRVTQHGADAGSQLLGALLKTDEGVSRLGELGIGMNRGITDFSRNVLFDGKMGDTPHGGRLRYPDAGGKNASAIHVDMIKGMKEGGAIYFDDDSIYSDGKFVWERGRIMSRS